LGLYHQGDNVRSTGTVGNPDLTPNRPFFFGWNNQNIVFENNPIQNRVVHCVKILEITVSVLKNTIKVDVNCLLRLFCCEKDLKRIPSSRACFELYDKWLDRYSLYLFS
jgi:hypothetical protein